MGNYSNFMCAAVDLGHCSHSRVIDLTVQNLLVRQKNDISSKKYSIVPKTLCIRRYSKSHHAWVQRAFFMWWFKEWQLQSRLLSNHRLKKVCATLSSVQIRSCTLSIVMIALVILLADSLPFWAEKETGWSLIFSLPAMRQGAVISLLHSVHANLVHFLLIIIVWSCAE